MHGIDLLHQQENIREKHFCFPYFYGLLAVFKGLKVINFESTKLVAKGGFNFIVSHRFGTVKNGFKNLFGLDEAVTHLNFVYGISDNLNISASRSSNQKIYEVGTKFRILVSLIDLYPTFIDYCKLKGDNRINEKGGKLGGHSLRPLMENSEWTVCHFLIFGIFFDYSDQI